MAIFCGLVAFLIIAVAFARMCRGWQIIFRMYFWLLSGARGQERMVDCVVVRRRTICSFPACAFGDLGVENSENFKLLNMVKEELKTENKTVRPSDPLWDWEMTRTIAALYNYGGGILRAGVDDNGNS